MEAEDEPERAPKDDYMLFFSLGNDEHPLDEELMNEFDVECDDPHPVYVDEVRSKKIVSENIDKHQHRIQLGMTQEDIIESHNWIGKNETALSW